MTEAKNVKGQFFPTKICKILAFARFLCLLLRSPKEDRAYFMLRFPAPLSKQSTPVPVMGRLLL